MGGKFNSNHAKWQRLLDLFNEPVWGHSSPAFINDLVDVLDLSCISSHRMEGVDQINDVLARGLG